VHSVGFGAQPLAHALGVVVLVTDGRARHRFVALQKPHWGWAEQVAQTSDPPSGRPAQQRSSSAIV
jgi:hypothetical protein